MRPPRAPPIARAGKGPCLRFAAAHPARVRATRPMYPSLASGHAKAQEAAPLFGRAFAAERRPRVDGRGVPAPAPNHAEAAPRRATDGSRPRIDVQVHVSTRAPLPDIPEHVEQSGAVRQLASTRSRPLGQNHSVFL